MPLDFDKPRAPSKPRGCGQRGCSAPTLAYVVLACKLKAGEGQTNYGRQIGSFSRGLCKEHAAKLYDQLEASMESFLGSDPA